MDVKFDDYCEGLVLNVFFDEGMGQIIEGGLYSLIFVDLMSFVFEILVVNMIFVQLLIYFGEFFGWVLLGVYMIFLVNYSLVFKNLIFEEEVFNQCYKWFYEGKL